MGCLINCSFKDDTELKTFIISVDSAFGIQMFMSILNRKQLEEIAKKYRVEQIVELGSIQIISFDDLKNEDLDKDL